MAKAFSPEHERAQEILRKYGVPSTAALGTPEPGEEEDDAVIVGGDEGGQQDPSVAPAAPTKPALATPAVPAAPAPAAPSAPAPAAPEPPKAETDEERERRLANREESAKAEQRKLSGLQRQLTNKLAEVDALIADLKTQKVAPAAPAKPPAAPAEDDPTLADFKANNPALTEVLTKLIAQSGQSPQMDSELATQLQARLDAMEKTVSTTTYATAKERNEADILGAHPDAKQILSTETFEDYLEDLPKEIGQRAYQGFYKDIGRADTQFLNWVLANYKTQNPGAAVPAAPAAPAAPRPPRAPSITPAGAGASKPATALAPLSIEERRNFSALVNQAGSNAEARKVLFQRMNLSLNQS